MSKAHISREAWIGGRVGSGDARAPDIAGLLALIAAPTFAAMALWNGFFSGQPDVLCLGGQDSSPLGGMTLMYVLMSAFHLAPWLKLISSRRTIMPGRLPGIRPGRSIIRAM